MSLDMKEILTLSQAKLQRTGFGATEQTDFRDLAKVCLLRLLYTMVNSFAWRSIRHSLIFVIFEMHSFSKKSRLPSDELSGSVHSVLFTPKVVTEAVFFSNNARIDLNRQCLQHLSHGLT